MSLKGFMFLFFWAFYTFLMTAALFIVALVV